MKEDILPKEEEDSFSSYLCVFINVWLKAKGLIQKEVTFIQKLSKKAEINQIFKH